MSAFAGEQPLAHGGDVSAVRRLFPGAPEPFIDLSTGINPHPYPLPRLSAGDFARLPQPAALAALAEAGARAYGAPSAACVVPAPGTQILLPLVAGLAPAGRAVIVGPSYGEFARAAALAGHRVSEVPALTAIADAKLVLLANPNNPDGRLFTRNDLISLARHLHPRGGILVVDEAFIEAGPLGASVAPEICVGNLVVLRSFGKFFGLAGVRLGFALAAPPLAARLAALLGPWAVSGPALAVGAKALTDAPWIEKTKTRLQTSAVRLNAILSAANLEIVGGTSLFLLVRTTVAEELFQHLGRAGISVRRFPERAEWLRFGLPSESRAWRRLQIAMAAFRHGR